MGETARFEVFGPHRLTFHDVSLRLTHRSDAIAGSPHATGDMAFASPPP